MSILDTLKRRGILGTARHAVRLAGRRFGWCKFRFRHVSRYQEPAPDELAMIEKDLLDPGIRVEDYHADVDAFKILQAADYFPVNYHGGVSNGIYCHFILEISR